MFYKIFVNVLLFAFFCSNAFASDESILVHEYGSETQRGGALTQEIQRVIDAGYVQAGEPKAIFVKTRSCTPACGHLYLVVQPFFRVVGGYPSDTSTAVAAVYEILISAGNPRTVLDVTFNKVVDPAQFAELLN